MNITTESPLAKPVNPIYLAFKEPGIHLELFAPALVYALTALIGMPLNFSVCYITMKYRKSHGTLGSKTGFLIALNSGFEMMHQSSHFIFLAIAASGINFIPIRLGLIIEGYAMFGFVSTFNMFTLSLDRLFAVAAPILYRQINKWLYILAHLLFLLAYNLYTFACLISAAANYPDWPVTGLIGDLFTVPQKSTLGYFLAFAFIGSTIFVYLIVAILVKYKTEVDNERMRRLYRSLCLIVFSNIFGYLLGIIFILLYIRRIIHMTLIQFWFIDHIFGLALNIASSSNAPILFFNSTDYQNAYRKELADIKKLIFRIFCSSRLQKGGGVVVVPISVQVRTNGERTI